MSDFVEEKLVERIVIASIWPDVLVERRNFFPVSRFAIDACKDRSNPVLLTLTNQYEWVDVPLRKQKDRRLVPVEHIAADLINKWTEAMLHCTSGRHPGVWICRDAEGNYADTWRQEEWESALAAQTEYANVWLAEGDKLHGDNKSRFISPVSKLMANWLGIPKEWLRQVTTEDHKSCPLCTQTIPGSAIVCPKCTQIVDIEAYAQREAALSAARASVKATAAKQQQPLPPPIQPNVPKQPEAAR